MDNQKKLLTILCAIAFLGILATVALSTPAIAQEKLIIGATFNLTGEVIPSVNEAIKKAVQSASENDLIFIGGSTFVVAEIENL